MVVSILQYIIQAEILYINQKLSFYIIIHFFFTSLILQHTWSKESQPCKLFATILSNDDLKLQHLQEQINTKVNETALTI